MKRVAIATILATLLLLTIPTAVSATGISVTDRTGEGIWDNNTWQVEMFPGETKATTLTLYNSSSSSLNVEATVTPNLLDNGNLSFELDKLTFIMSGGSYTDVILTVRASGSATPGVYTTELEVRSESLPPPVGGGGGGGGIPSIFGIHGLAIRNITEDSADISWKTTRATTTKLTYWSNPRTAIENESYIYIHLVCLRNLKDDTTYYFEITCRDRYGLEKGIKNEFTTLKAEVVPEPELPEPEEPEPETPEPAEPSEPEPSKPGQRQEMSWKLIAGTVGGLVLVIAGIVCWMRKQE